VARSARFQAGEVAKRLGNGLQNRYTPVRIRSSPPQVVENKGLLRLTSQEPFAFGIQDIPRALGTTSRGVGTMVGMLYTSQRISFLRQALDVLDTAVRQELARLEAVDRSRMSKGELVALGDQYIDLHDQVEGLGHKMVIVSLSSLVESTFGIMLRQNAPALYPKGRTDRRKLRDAVDRMHGGNMERLAGWPQTELIRLLSNCFKHEDGFASLSSDSGKKLKAWVDANPSTSIDFEWAKHVNQDNGKIDFGALPVAKYIEHVEIFLNELEAQAPVQS
jgi:hypothetical protein